MILCIFARVDAARTFLLFFSLLFRPQLRRSPQHEKIAHDGNVFVLWVASLVTPGGASLVTKMQVWSRWNDSSS